MNRNQTYSQTIGSCRPQLRIRGTRILVFLGTNLVMGVLGALLATQPVGAEQGGPVKVSATATLTILAGDVTHVPAGSGQPQAAKDGMNVGVGDRILTGPNTFAIVTFLDGSTFQVCPDSDVTIKRADVGDKKSSISIRINFGLVWARVVRLLDPQSSFSLEANTVVASVHDGLIGARQNLDGSFQCWTNAGDLMVTEKFAGQAPRILQAGQMIVFEPGKPQPAPPHPFATNQSALKITASAGVLPLVLMADKARVAGFVAPGIEVNQVFGSITDAGADGSHLVQVPAGAAGPFALVLDGFKDGPFTVRVSGLFKDKKDDQVYKPVYQLELSGTIKKGERVVSEITQQIEPATAGEPKTAKVQSGSATPFQPFSGPLPGKILLSPTEVQAAGGL